MAVEHVVVVGGGGLMGSGIAQVIASAGLQVTIVDVDGDAIERGLRRIERGLEKAGDDRGEARARISASTSLEEACAAADHVIESVIEDIDAKVEVLRRLDAVCSEDVIFATNTSQFPRARERRPPRAQDRSRAPRLR
jgi:3-hydroxybutyryl-CoA dehydrogenase